MIVEARRDVITLRGSLLDNEWPTIQAAAKLLLSEHPRGIIIDCSGLTEVSEAGARTFLDGINYIQRHDAKIIVAGLPENALRVIRGVRAVASQLPIAPTIEDARASLGLESVTEKLSSSNMRAVTVLLIGDWGRAIQIACRISDKRNDEIHLIDFLKIPRSMPLATPYPEAEAMAKQKLDDGERVAKEWRIRTVRHVERVRTVAEGLHRVLTLLRPEVLVVSVGQVDDETSELVNQVMPGLLADPPCEIIYNRRPANG